MPCTYWRRHMYASDHDRICLCGISSNGGAPRASIFMGKGDKESAERTLGNCFTTQIFVSFLLTLILFTGNRSFLMAFGASENTIPYAVAYMNIYSLGTIFVQLTLGMNAFITAQGFAKTGMLSVLVGAAATLSWIQSSFSHFIWVFGVLLLQRSFPRLFHVHGS